MSSTDTRLRILDAAEGLFAEQGYAATSLRQITGRAGANLAAVNYHFGSKEDLAKAALARHLEPINGERLRRLAALPARAPVEAIVRAFVEPPLRASPAQRARQAGRPAERLCRLFGRISLEQPAFLRSFLAGQFREVADRFERALVATLPGHGAATIWWRLHFLVGAMAHTLQNSATLSHLTGKLCDPDDKDALVEQLVAFATGGLRAPAVAGPRRPGRVRTEVGRA